MVDSYIELPNRPGIGVELDEVALAKYPSQVRCSVYVSIID